MASAFGHALVALTAGAFVNKPIRSGKLLFLGTVCSIISDIDVISFQFGIPYEAFLGHRGFTHSLLFALIIGVLITRLFFNPLYALEDRNEV